MLFQNELGDCSVLNNENKLQPNKNKIRKGSEPEEHYEYDTVHVASEKVTRCGKTARVKKRKRYEMGDER